MSTSPITWFFSLGDKVTKGDPARKADFDYYMLWVMFIAFFSVFIGYASAFYKSLALSQLGWAFVILCILWFQYYTLKGAREARKMIKSMPRENKKEDNKIENLDEMIKGFNSPQTGLDKNLPDSSPPEKEVSADKIKLIDRIIENDF